MPPRSRKRKSYGLGARRSKRRRVSRRVTFRQRPRRFKTRRTRLFRRFKRSFNRRRRSRRRTTPDKIRHRLEFKLTPQREAMFTYGQQHTVPNTTIEQECIYFTTELFNAAVTDKVNVVTRSLLGYYDIMQVADYAWTNTPNNVHTGVNTGWVNDMQWGPLFIKGVDEYTLRNQSNETITLTGYVCRGRKDTIRYVGSLTENIYNFLGEGFAENGYNPGTSTAANSALTMDNMNPRQSRMFCRNFKIVNQIKKVIGPGMSTKYKIWQRWRKFIPVDYVHTDNLGRAWLDKTPRYSHIKGEKFVLWKLHPPIGGVVDQVTYQKQITQTTPTVIMQTTRHLWYKHLPRPLGSINTFEAFGIDDAVASIIVDEDEKKGAEIDAS